MQFKLLISGATIATLFFFPLLNGLATSPNWLHWTFFDSFETLISWMILTGVVSTTFLLTVKNKDSAFAYLIYLTWLAIGIFFAAGGLVKLSIVKEYVQPYRHLAVLFALVTIGIAIISFVIALKFQRVSKSNHLRKFILCLWPLTLVMGIQLIVAPLRNFQTDQFPASGESLVGHSIPHSLQQIQSLQSVDQIVILLFDELSVDYLYGNRSSDLSNLPSLQRYLSLANLYTNVTLTGSRTEFAIPSLFAVNKNGNSGLLEFWKQKDISFSIWGWFLDYCSTFATAAEKCHSNSFFNPRTLTHKFFPFTPIWTNFNLLPAEWPFNLIKNPAATYLHLRTFQATKEWLIQQLDNQKSRLIYVHFNIPHTPLINKESSVASTLDPFDKSLEGYRSQLELVDDVIYSLLSRVRQPSNLIILSDHNLRSATPSDQHEHVVFSQLSLGSDTPHRIERPMDASQLLRDLSGDGWQSLSSTPGGHIR